MVPDTRSLYECLRDLLGEPEQKGGLGLLHLPVGRLLLPLRLRCEVPTEGLPLPLVLLRPVLLLVSVPVQVDPVSCPGPTRERTGRREGVRGSKESGGPGRCGCRRLKVQWFYARREVDGVCGPTGRELRRMSRPVQRSPSPPNTTPYLPLSKQRAPEGARPFQCRGKGVVSGPLGLGGPACPRTTKVLCHRWVIIRSSGGRTSAATPVATRFRVGTSTSDLTVEVVYSRWAVSSVRPDVPRTSGVGRRAVPTP